MTQRAIRRVPAHETVDDGLERRFRQAWRTAFKAAGLLRERHGVRQVRVIGSLLRRELFHEESDIDLVLPGKSPGQAFDMGKSMEELYPWQIDLIPLKGMNEKKQEFFFKRSVPIETGD